MTATVWIAASALLTGACSDPTALRADLQTETSVVTLYSLTGTQPGLPAAVSLPANQAVLMDGNFFYDVVFDIDNQARPLLIPMELTVWNRIGAHRVGIQKVSGTFEQVLDAPESGYVSTTPLEVQVGDVLVVESQDPRVCNFPYPTRMYARIGIEDIDVETRSIRFRMTLNPNCGFRSFLAGIPSY